MRRKLRISHNCLIVAERDARFANEVERLMQFVEIKEEPVFTPLSRRYTLQEFWALPEPEDRCHYDLIGGYLFMVPPPASPHGSIDSRLNKLLVKFLLDNNIEGEVHHPHEPIYRSGKRATYLEPDMMFVFEDRAREMEEKRTSADIVFEYASKSTAVYDRTTKAQTYLALDVRELWIIDSSTMTIEVRNAASHDGQPVWEGWRYSKGERAESKVLQGWTVSADELFDGLEKFSGES